MVLDESGVFFHAVAQEVEEGGLETGEAVVESGNVGLAEGVGFGVSRTGQLVDDGAAGVTEAHDLGAFVHGFARGIVDGLAEDFHLVVAVHADDLGVASAHE